MNADNYCIPKSNLILNVTKFDQAERKEIERKKRFKDKGARKKRFKDKGAIEKRKRQEQVFFFRIPQTVLQIIFAFSKDIKNVNKSERQTEGFCALSDPVT